MIRDHEDNWLHGFYSNFGSCDPLMAELCAVKQRLQLIWDKGYRKLLFEVDSLEVCRMLTNDIFDPHLQSKLYFLCGKLIKRDWSFQLGTSFVKLTVLRTSLQALVRSFILTSMSF